MNKKQFGLLLLIVGIVGFFYFTNAKSNYRIYEQRFTQTKIHKVKLEAKENNSYTMFFWAVDEETGIQQWAEIQLIVSVKTQSGELIKREKRIATVSDSEETGGIKRAENGLDFTYQSKSDQTILIEADLQSGDYVDIEIYENLPEGLNLYPGLAIIFGLVGLVVYLKGRAKN